MCSRNIAWSTSFDIKLYRLILLVIYGKTIYKHHYNQAMNECRNWNATRSNICEARILIEKCPGMKPSKRASIQLWFQWRICCHNVLKLAVQYFGFCFRNVLKCELLKYNVVLRNICLYRSLFIHFCFVETWNIWHHFLINFLNHESSKNCWSRFYRCLSHYNP